MSNGTKGWAGGLAGEPASQNTESVKAARGPLAQSQNQAAAAKMPQHALRDPARALPAGDILALQRLLGNGAVQRLLALRADQGERDANGVADGAEAAVARASSSAGSPLAAPVRSHLENSLQADLSSVRVHTGSESADAADAVGATAYTVGQDIHFGAGRYAPTESAGLHLLAHEVAHTLQQKGSAGTPDANFSDAGLEVSSPGDAAEIEAEQTAAAVVSRSLLTENEAAVAMQRNVSRDRVVHRAWSDADPGTYPASKDPSQPATPQGGWNASNQMVGGVERIPLEGLKEGLQASTPRSKQETDDEKGQPSKEGADGKAIAVVPTLKADQPVEILLHLHGHNVGYRERAKSDGTAMDPGSVRDVAADRIEQQLGASGRNMIAILPQGTTMSGFGAFKPEAYITEVWGMLTAMKKLPPNAKRGAVVLSGHSGAASPITQMLSTGNLPTGLGELVLFDSIHTGQRPTVETFLKSRMGADVKALKDLADPHLNGGLDAAKVTANQTDYLSKSFRFRGIFTPKFHPQKKDEQNHLMWQDPETKKKPVIDETVWAGYGVEYEPLRDTIKAWMDANTKGFDASIAAALRENYKVIPAGAGATHNTILGANNNLENALSVLPVAPALPSTTPPSTTPGTTIPPTTTPTTTAPVKTGALESAPEDDAASELAANETVPVDSTETADSSEATTIQAKRERPIASATSNSSAAVRISANPAGVNAPAQSGGETVLRRQLDQMAGDNVVQRQPAPPPLTDAEQWDQDWNSHVAQQGYFSDTLRPSGTPRQRYDILCPLYKSHGIPRPMVYLASSITTATFYGFSTEAHTDLATAMKKAETALKAKGYNDAPVTKVGALNARTTSEGGWSNHAAGKAVDLDSDNNPRLADPTERKVISAVSATDMEEGSQGYDVLKGASDRFKADYNPAGMQRRITELKATETAKETERDTVKAERDTLKEQRQQLKTDRGDLQKQLKAVPQGKKATADDKAKAEALKASILQKDADLAQNDKDIKQKEKDLKKKEAELKAATKDRELIEKQLTTYEATDKAISDLENTVTSLPNEIKTLEDQIAQSKQDEQDARTAKNADGVKAQQKLRAKLESALSKDKSELKKKQAQLDKKKKDRDADPLRKYAAEGILNLSKDVVEAMTGAGLKWGGEWKEVKDFMHFEL